MMTKQEADGQADILLEIVKSGPYSNAIWCMDVWKNNEEWHAAVFSQFIWVGYNKRMNKYSCFVNNTGTGSCGDCFIHAGEIPHEGDPNQAIERRLHQIENWIKGLSTTLDDIKLSVGVEL